ncbi:MAG: response regulator [Planctomycetota bacterium]
MTVDIIKKFENNRKTLIIEDDPTMQILLQETLTLRGYEVDIYNNGKDGMEAFGKNFYQLVILDWKLPDVTGVELCEKMRKSKHSAFISIIMITSNNTPEHLQTAFDAGADDYITKPFPISLLEIRLLIAEQRAQHRRERAKAEEALVRAQQLAAVGTLAAGVAHEFNNIHTSVIGYLQLTLGCQIDEEADQYVKRVLGAAKRAVGITKNLLAFTRSKTAGKRNSDINMIVNDTLSIISEEIKSEGIGLEVDLEENLPDIYCDNAQIGQVIMNLLINARHAVYKCDTRVISIKTGKSGNYIYVKVKDTGAGISEDEKKKVFLPFFSTKGEYAKKNSPSSDIKGTGLGLSVCDTIARNHNGKIEFESKINEGSSFTLYLALQQTDIQAEEFLPESTVRHTPGRILILDDEEDIRQLLSTLLTNQGHEICTTDDGEEAVKMHQSKPFDIALVDLQMPKLDGHDFIEKLEKLPDINPDIIIITGRFTNNNIAKAEEFESVVMTVRKPFDIYKVSNQISELMQKKHRRQQV